MRPKVSKAIDHAHWRDWAGLDDAISGGAVAALLAVEDDSFLAQAREEGPDVVRLPPGRRGDVTKQGAART